MLKFQIIIVCFIGMGLKLMGQSFYFGNDLSYANMMEDCGAVFKENNQPKDVYQIFADHGTNLVRVRLWHNPSWQNSLIQPVGVKNQYSDYADVKETIQRAKNAGMQVMLGFHFSDFWADPGRQVVPAAWFAIADSIDILNDSVYNYVTYILTDLENSGILPEIVKIGNETNNGLIRHYSMDGDYNATDVISSSWARHAQIYNSAIQAVRDVSASTSIKPKIALHMAGLGSVAGWYSNIINYGVTDFDIIGFSYYYAWHGESINTLGTRVSTLKSTYPEKEIMAVDTGYAWTNQNFDDLGNIISVADPQYEPLSPEKQLEYMVDYAKAVKENGGSGVIFWEPDWVSTPCRTPWGQGSSQEDVAFFEIDSYNFMEHGGGRWTDSMFYVNQENVIVTFKVDMTGEDVSNGVFITGSFTGETWQLLPMYNAGNNIFTYTTAMMPGDTGAYYYLNDSSWGARELVPPECALMFNTDRKYSIDDHHTIINNYWSICGDSAGSEKVEVSFKVNMTGQDVSRGVYITGEMNSWVIDPMTDEGDNIFGISYDLTPGNSFAYYHMTTNSWVNYESYRETVPAACALKWDSDRVIEVPDKDTIVLHAWESCSDEVGINDYILQNYIEIKPVPAKEILNIHFEGNIIPQEIQIINITGQTIKKVNIQNNIKSYSININDIKTGVYLVRIKSHKDVIYKQFIKQ